jgi:hypothetical protein
METDQFTRAVRTVFGRYVPVSKIEALRLALIRAGLLNRDGQMPYEAGRRSHPCIAR